jgi:hypothetical protein
VLALGAASAVAGDAETPWDAVLKANGLDASQVQLTKDRWREGGKLSLPVFERSWDDWTHLEPDSLGMARALLAAAPSFERLLVVSAGLAAVGSWETPLPNPPPPRGGGSLVATITSLEAFLGEPLSSAAVADLESRARSVPEAVAARASLVLAAVPAALEARSAALARFRPKGVPEEKRMALAWTKALEFATGYAVDATTLELIDAFDRDAMIRGARGLARAVDEASAPLTARQGAFAFTWTTRIGEIALGGDADDTYDRGPYLLVVDTGGNDTYRPRAPRTAASDYPIAISIDFAGNDLYQGDDLQFGVGILGYGFLLDASGDDRYEATDAGPGSGIFGVGIAIDRAGNDRYKVHRFGEGAGCFGVGVLADLAGDDEYLCLQLAQGFGATRGVGALVDVSGNDRYEADDVHLEVPSAQTKDHNVSLSQGCGFGRRAHPGDGHSFAGGLGLLVDGSGNDHYSSGVFGQGVGYWYGMGVLVDQAGDDDYKGVWYAQGSAAHYAIGALLDLAGNDRYVSQAQSQGQGHDWSIGLLVDASGDDDYRCSGMSLGTGHINGIGLFRDGGGTDHFVGSGQSFGEAVDPGPGQTIGIFVATGKGRFEPGPPGKSAREPGRIRLRQVR